MLACAFASFCEISTVSVYVVVTAPPPPPWWSWWCREVACGWPSIVCCLRSLWQSYDISSFHGRSVFVVEDTFLCEWILWTSGLLWNHSCLRFRSLFHVRSHVRNWVCQSTICRFWTFRLVGYQWSLSLEQLWISKRLESCSQIWSAFKSCQAQVMQFN